MLSAAEERTQSAGSAPGAESAEAPLRRYSLLHAFYMSFYSGSFYEDVGRRWKGIGAAYLFLLVALSWVPWLIRTQREMNEFVHKQGPALVQQIPDLNISGGRVSTPERRPYLITDPETGKLFAIIDVSGEITSLEDSEARFLLTETQLIGKKTATETRVYNLSEVEEFSLDQATMRRWVNAIGTWFGPVLYPVAVVGTFFYRLMQMLLYAAVGLLFCKATLATLSYAALMRLSVMAVTPVILLDAVHDLVNKPIPAWSLLCLGLAMAYLFFGVRANAPKIGESAFPPAPAA